MAFVYVASLHNLHPNAWQEDLMDTVQTDLKTRALDRACADAIKAYRDQATQITTAREWVEQGLVTGDPEDNAYECDGLRLDQAHCPCPEGTGPRLCVHRLAVGLLRKSLRYWRDLEAKAEHPRQTPQDAPQGTNGRTAEESAVPQPENPPEDALDSVPRQFIVEMGFGQERQRHLSYRGLMWLAERRRDGLRSLSATFVSVTPVLALATATATFGDGSTWTEAGDATPENVNTRMKPSFARMALTRAKARCLRDALGVGTAAYEEL